MGVKLCFQKLNRAALDVDWSRKRHRWKTSRGPETTERRPGPQGRATGTARRRACRKRFGDKISRILETDCARGEVSGFSSPRYWVNHGVTSITLHRKTRFGRNREFALEMTFSREAGVVPWRVIHIQISLYESEVDPCRHTWG